jgi:hypothetical protein
MDTVYLQLSRYIQPTVIILGTIGALINQALFHFRKPLRSTSCALYFRARSTNDLFVLWLVIFPQWLSTQFNIDPTTQYDWYCKIYTYLSYVLYTLSPYFVVLACFDRLCTSSPNARLRKIATKPIAHILARAMAILPLIVYCYVLIWCKLVSTPFAAYCGIINPIYGKLLAYSLLCLFSLLPPVLMIIFCTITVLFLRQQRHRIMPVNQARIRHRDNQLLKMLFIYVTSNIICTAPFTIVYFIAINFQGNVSSEASSMISMFIVLANMNYATSFYIYTLGTPFYRDELYKLCECVRKRLNRNQNAAIDLQPRRITQGRTECGASGV